MIDLEKLKKELSDKYPNITIHSLSDEGSGKVGMEVGVGKKELAYLNKDTKFQAIMPRLPEAASVKSRWALDRSDLDLAEASVLSLSPQEMFQRSIDYYYTKDIYGSVIRNLANFASKGFENDIDDEQIKSFYDNWAFDIGLEATVEQIFFDVFRVGMVRTYKIVGKYVPNINIYEGDPLEGLPRTREDSSRRKKDTAAKKHKWSREHIPIKYTILNPLALEINGSMFFDQTYVSLKAEALKEIRDLISIPVDNLTDAQKAVLNAIPNDMKAAAKTNTSYTLDPYLVGAVDYRRQPYDRYPKPRGVNAFECIEYKNELRKADYSTLDGITNYILKITVGNDEFPVTDNAVLENVAELFNTPSKSFDIVWNHTLKIEKIVSPEIEAVLGQQKYAQVNDDYTGALGFVRALIDGGGNISSSGAVLAVKGIISEIEYVRSQVKRWLYSEYRDVAEAMGFGRYPVVRFNDVDLRDELQMMRVVMGLVDRRMISYETGIKALGKDFNTELSRLKKEKSLVIDGTLGIIGSPYNPKLSPFLGPQDNVQPVQKTPTGTPSEGRPPGTDTPRTKATKVRKSKKEKAKELLENLSEEDRKTLIEDIYKGKV